MPRPSLADKSYLERKHGAYRVVVSVPRSLHPVLSTKLRRYLPTDSLAVANKLKWPIIAEFKHIIAEAGSANGEEKDYLKIGVSLARQIRDAKDRDLKNDLIYGAAITGELIENPALRDTFAEVVRGDLTPIEHLFQQFLASYDVKRGAKGDAERAIKFILEWCKRTGTPPMLQAFTKKVAVRFMDELHAVAGVTNTITLEKYIYRLSRYWQWLERREEVEFNPWHGLRYDHKKDAYDEKERPFTDDEMLKLLEGVLRFLPERRRQGMFDLMRIGALTGCRLDPIVDLHARDIGFDKKGVPISFTFKPQKKEEKPRLVPIHSSLVELVKQRVEGAEPGGDLFPEWPKPKNENSERERSFKASNAFTKYRRSCGVDEMIPGKRRSLVNFHSFRRWFITKAEQADQPESTIAVVVGHRRKGITLGVYSAGPLFEQARRCVEAVKLPIRVSRATRSRNRSSAKR